MSTKTAADSFGDAQAYLEAFDNGLHIGTDKAMEPGTFLVRPDR